MDLRKYAHFKNLGLIDKTLELFRRQKRRVAWKQPHGHDVQPTRENQSSFIFFFKNHGIIRLGVANFMTKNLIVLFHEILKRGTAPLIIDCICVNYRCSSITNKVLRHNQFF